MLKLFLPSLVRGVYRYDQLIKNTDNKKFIKTKWAFLPNEYKEFFEQQLKFSNDLSNNILTLSATGLSETLTNKKNRFFKKHQNYFKNWQNPDGEIYYLEVKFIVKILTYLFKADGLDKFEPQKKIGSYFVDFAIQGDKKYVIELDGFGKFEYKDALDKFLQRQNYLTSQGWTIYRYSYSDVINSTEKTAKEIVNIFSHDKQLCRFIESNFSQDLQEDLTELNNFNHDIVETINLFYAIQDFFIKKYLENPTEKIYFLADKLGFDFSLIACSLSSLYHYFDSLNSIFDLPFTFPELQIINYYLHEIPSLHPKISFKEKSIFDYPIEFENRVLLDFIQQNKPPYTSFTTINFRNPAKLNINDKIANSEIEKNLGYLAKSIFGYEDNKTGTRINTRQRPIFRRIFQQQDVLALLPTGSGKSFCFWLPALIKFGLSIVISPLRSLMLDQDISLKNFGINSSAFINSDISNAGRDAIYTDIKLGNIRILYIAPERLLIKKFRDELSSILNIVPINFLIIDEAHCVSEWGHDFRPSYLGIPDFVAYLKIFNSKLTIIALTATAGEIVKRDMMNILNLTDEKVESAENFDRPELSYQVIKVNSYAEKYQAYDKVINHDIVTALKQKNMTTLFSTLTKRQEKPVGLVFCIYADPHGKESIHDGIASYLDKTQRLLEHRTDFSIEDFGTGKIRAFSSKEPTLCPHCDSPYYNNVGDSKYQCDSRHQFSQNKAIKPPNWGAITKGNQEAFKSSELDILVTTKGFGMGIDKGSTRFAIHTAMAGSIESWYQEIGRAGRDGEASHCVQIVDVPLKVCYEEYLNNTKPPPCNFRSGCSYPNKQGLCDYGKQHNFIKSSYPSVDADAMQILRILNKLLDASLNQEEDIIYISTSLQNQNNIELALHRLLIIGVIEKFFIDYRNGSVFFEIDGFNFLVNEKDMLDKTFIYLQNNDISQNKDKYNTKEKVLSIIENSEYWQLLSTKLAKEKLSHHDKYKEFFHIISGYLLVILHHIYDDVRRMRYNLLQDLLSEIVNTKNCQRVAVVRYFSPDMAITENYRCGFCSSCVGDLNFKIEKANPLEFSKDSEDVLRRLDDILSEKHIFDWNELFNIAVDLKLYPKDAYARARRTLGYSPRNLSALFIAKEFSEKSTIKRDLLYFIEIASEDFDLENSITAYETVSDNYKVDVFQLLTREISVLNCPQGEYWLYEEARRLNEKSKFSKKSVEYLGARVIANRLAETNLSKHKVKLKELLRDL